MAAIKSFPFPDISCPDISSWEFGAELGGLKSETNQNGLPSFLMVLGSKGGNLHEWLIYVVNVGK